MSTRKNAGPLETAVRLLARRDHTEQEIRSKLRHAEYSPDDIDETVMNLREKGYLNDDRLRQNMIEKMVAEKRHGLRSITGKLRQAGIPACEEDVRKLYSEETEWENAVKLLNRRFSTWDRDSFPRLARFIMNRGFSSCIMSRLAEECRKQQ